jgi:plastocyanin
MDRRHLASLAALATVALTLGVGCPEEPKGNASSGGPKPPPAKSAETTATAKPTSAPTGATAAAPTGAGTIKGTVKLTGKPVEMKVPTARAKAEFCKDKQIKYNAVVADKDGKLADVLVRIVNGGVKGKFEAPSAHAAVNQQDCMYAPRIQGVVAGQTIDIKNSDGTLHNVHTYKGSESWFNQGQPKGSDAIAKEMPDEATVVRMSCDVHPWMRAFVVVTDHPFFSVSKEDGTFEISKIPAGEYDVEAWHSHYGLKKGTAKVKVEDGKPASVDFTFDEKDAEPAENKDELKGLW